MSTSTWRDRVRAWNSDAGVSRLPLIQAPMAGGPSCPSLATAVARAGGIGFLAAGYLTPEALARQIGEVFAADVPVAVNVFLPDEDPPDAADEIARYATELKSEADRVGATLDPAAPYTDDAYREKIERSIGELPWRRSPSDARRSGWSRPCTAKARR